MIKLKIKDLREDNDLTQQNLANYLHISRSSYRDYENGDRGIPISVLSEIADYYKTSIDYLVGKTDTKKPYPKIK